VRINYDIFEHVEIIDAGPEGKAVGRVGSLVIFVPFVVPGDIVDVKITRKKRSYLEGRAVRFHHYSEKRADVFCEHFGTCGGCRWQNMKYEEQLHFKQKQVGDNIERIAKIENAVILPIIPSPDTKFYRNKLEFTFSNRRWLMEEERDVPVSGDEMNALGFHLPLLFDKILDINNCYLQQAPSNAIRLEAKKYALDNHLSFYNVHTWQGLLRNLIIRNSLSGDLMVIVVFNAPEMDVIERMLEHLQVKFPAITSLFYVINPKKNDTLSDLPFHHYKGQAYLTESFPAYGSDKQLSFRIGPGSFFQTNSVQGRVLYKTAADFAGFRGDETVYDLYTGIGSMANYIAGTVSYVIGIESSTDAVKDAAENSKFNNIANTLFYPGEAEKVLTPEFVAGNGIPDIVITDPPRSGMHEKVIKALLSVQPPKIVYISCNPATQARDLMLLKEQYELVKCQPVDMFPHTQHVENIMLLEHK
jgi:23S rRNA (uracil1939-C5)-methyltransferase